MSQTRKLGSHQTSVFIDNDLFTNVVYHQTAVVKFNSKKVVLNSNGWLTNTTKTRMNQAANQFRLGFQVFQKSFNWFVNLPNGEAVPFADNMEFSL